MTEIENKWLKFMNSVGRALDEALNQKKKPKQWGFFLAIFPFDSGPGRFNYLSNADRKDIIALMKEMTAKFEGQPDVEGHG
jgi:hypothetical protein